MPQVIVTVVYSRFMRFRLHCEWHALPIAVGQLVAMPMWFVGMQPTGTGPWITRFLVCLTASLLLGFGLDCPMHRRLGLRRNSIWRGPLPGDDMYPSIRHG